MESHVRCVADDVCPVGGDEIIVFMPSVAIAVAAVTSPPGSVLLPPTASQFVSPAQVRARSLSRVSHTPDSRSAPHRAACHSPPRPHALPASSKCAHWHMRVVC